jgi:hypothetical protein
MESGYKSEGKKENLAHSSRFPAQVYNREAQLTVCIPLVTANTIVIPLILVTLKMEATCSSERRF